jgi:pimeloyl-[acyl-carrier protein] synthase
VPETSAPLQLFQSEMLPDPYPVFHRLRTEDPVHWHAPFGSWIVTRYDDVVAGLLDPRLSSDRAGPMESLAGVPELSPFFSYLGCRMDFRDPPAHGRLRRLAQAPFAPHAIESLRPMVQRLVDGFLDRIQAQGSMDVIWDLAYPLPGTVIGELLGVPATDRDQLKKWSDEFVGFFKTVPSQTSEEDYRRSHRAARELGDYFRGVLSRSQGSAGLLGALARAEEEGDRLSAEELSANATLLLHAGHETTTHLIGNGLLALLQHPGELQRLRDESGLIPTAVEEFLRFDSPVQLTYRRAREDFELAGRPIRKGQVVHLVLAAANRDPAHFPDPDRLDVGRTPNKHLAFGHGHHFCLGAWLARLEAQVAFETLLRRCSGLRLTEGPVEYQENYILRGLKSLPVAWG